MCGVQVRRLSPVCCPGRSDLCALPRVLCHPTDRDHLRRQLTIARQAAEDDVRGALLRTAMVANWVHRPANGKFFSLRKRQTQEKTASTACAPLDAVSSPTLFSTLRRPGAQKPGTMFLFIFSLGGWTFDVSIFTRSHARKGVLTTTLRPPW